MKVIWWVTDVFKVLMSFLIPFLVLFNQIMLAGGLAVTLHSMVTVSSSSGMLHAASSDFPITQRNYKQHCCTRNVCCAIVLTGHCQSGFSFNLMVVIRHNTFVGSFLFPVSTVNNHFVDSSSKYDGIICSKWTITIYYCFCFGASFSGEIPFEYWYGQRMNWALELHPLRVICRKIMRLCDETQCSGSCM